MRYIFGPRIGWKSPARVAAVLGLLAAAVFLASPNQTVRAYGSTDAVAVAEAIERLPVVGSVLLTGAHPDDENNALLAYLARGLHLRTAYLSETRGDGGQNLLGTEQYEALGMLRSEELLAARQVDGAQQFFGQAYDFGFSKSAEETLAKWGHDTALTDYVRIIRQFRPDVVISRFSGTPADGHGHHQASGILTKEAFRAAADAGRFSSLLDQGLMPWQASSLFINVGGPGGRANAGPDAFTVTLGGYDPLYGEEYGDIGRDARSNHRSQGMGGVGGRGPYTATFLLADSVGRSTGRPTGLFDGIDLTLNRYTTLANGAPAVAQDVAAMQKFIDQARSMLNPVEPSRVLPSLAQALASLRDIEKQVGEAPLPARNKDQLQFLLSEKEEDFARAVALAGGVAFEAHSNTGELVPGSTFEVAVRVSIAASKLLQQSGLTIEAPSGWKVLEQTIEAARQPNSRAAPPGGIKFLVTVNENAQVSQPYWLSIPRKTDFFVTDPSMPVGAPFNRPLLTARLKLNLANGADMLTIEESQPVSYLYTDRIYGEREAPPVVVPAVAVWADPALVIVPYGATGASAARAVIVRVRNMTDNEQRGSVRLEAPQGWKPNPPSIPFTLAKRDETSFRFQLTADAQSAPQDPQKGKASAIAEVGGSKYSTGFQVIDYPHVHRRYLFSPAELTLERFDVKVAPGLKVGYVMGSGDDVPDALKQLGVNVTQLGPEDLEFGDLSQYDVIVTGIRAYEVRKDLSTNHARLMDWVSNGGTMIVQYSRPGGFSDPLGPYPFSLGSQPRVSVEEAPVAILDPDNPLFHYPNTITPADFEGWVQERGTYFMEKWSPEYKPLLESHDPGEPPQSGGMLVAGYGKGLYAYTGYVWFRQLPAGVPGAYRLFANLISMGKATAGQ